MDSTKKWWQSKSIWAGIVAVVAALASYMTGETALAEFLLGANGVVQIILRLMTNQSISMK